MADRDDISALYTARPRVLLDGEESPDLAAGLLSLLVEETTAGLYRCEATVGNWGSAAGGSTGSGAGYLYFDRQTLDFGRSLAIEVGDGASAARVFDGRITGLEAHYPQQRPPELLVLAEDRLQDLRMTRRSRTFEDVSDSDVFERLASQHSLAAEIDVDGPSHRVLAQVNQSDLAFLRERARAVDAEVWIEGTELHVQARRRRRTAEVELTYGQRLLELSLLADLACQRTSLAVSGWDVGAKEGIDFEATETAIQGELDGGVSGSRVLQEAFGKRPERLVHHVPLSSQEAQTLAEARYRAAARRFVTAHGTAEGDGRLRAGSRAALRGLGELFDGSYYVTEVRHTFDLEDGYRTNFQAERPGLGGA